jgi:hypothetical protein
VHHARFCPRCTFPNAETNVFCAQCGINLKPKKIFTPGVTVLLIILGVVALGGIGLTIGVISNPKSFAPPVTAGKGVNVAPAAVPSATAVASVPAPAPTGTPKPPMEVMLATIDRGGPADADDIAVKRFRFLLGNIQRKTNNTRDQIGDMTVNGQKLLRDKYGKEMTLLDLMEDANRAMPEGSTMRWNYVEIMTAVVILEGQS